MSLLNVTGFAIRDSVFDWVVAKALVSGAGSRWQAARRQSATPNPNEANLFGSWELETGSGTLNNS